MTTTMLGTPDPDPIPTGTITAEAIHAGSITSATLAAAPPADAVARDSHWAAKMARLRSRKPTERTIRIPLDPAKGYELEDAKAALVRVHKDAGDDEPDADVLAPLIAAVDEAQAAVDASTESLTFRRLPDDVYEQLLAACPPTADDKAKKRTYEAAKFIPALMSACSVDGMPVEDAKELLGAMSNGEAEFLFGLLVALQLEIAIQVETR